MILNCGQNKKTADSKDPISNKTQWSTWQPLAEETVLSLSWPQPLLVNAAGLSRCEGQVCCFCSFFCSFFFFKIQSKSESYVSGITPRWVGMWTMPLCERERVSADHHHKDPGDATLLEGLLRLIAPKWHFLFFFFKSGPCAAQISQNSDPGSSTMQLCCIDLE